MESTNTCVIKVYQVTTLNSQDSPCVTHSLRLSRVEVKRTTTKNQ